MQNMLFFVFVGCFLAAPATWFVRSESDSTAQIAATFRASFLFRTSSCYLTPRFEFGCSEGGFLDIDEVESAGDTVGSVTCIIHPQKGDQYRLCTATVIIAGQGISFSQFLATFHCEGSSSDSLPSAIAATVPTSAQCDPSEDSSQFAYHFSTMSVYDWHDGIFADVLECEMGTPEELMDPALGYGCSHSEPGCGTTSTTVGCTLQMQETRTYIDGSALPTGAIQSSTTSQEDEGSGKFGMIAWTVATTLVTLLCILGLCVFVYCKRKAHKQQHGNDQVETTVGEGENKKGSSSQRSLTTIATAPVKSQRSFSKAVEEAAASRPHYRGMEVDADDIQRYGFSVIRKHLGGNKT